MTVKKKIPKARKISKDKVISIYREELKKKDAEIRRLEEEKQILFKLALKRKREEIEKKSG